MKNYQGALNKGIAFNIILLVVGIVGLLVISVTVIQSFYISSVLTPAKEFNGARDALRATNTNSILTAIYTYVVDNEGSFPPGLTPGMSEKQLGTSTSGCAVTTGGCAVVATTCLDLSMSLAKYIKSIPFDPNGGTISKTNYAVVVDSSGTVTVKACGAEGGNDIFATR